MARRSNSRRRPLATAQISPQSIRNEVVFPLPSRERIDAPLVVTDARKPLLLLGRARLGEHLRRSPDRLIDAVVVSDLDPADRASVACLEQLPEPAPSLRAAGVRALLDAGMGLAQLVACVPGLGSQAIASRWAALAGADPFVLRMLDAGRLSFSHTVLLLPLGRDTQRAWAERCVSGRWSCAALRRQLAEGAAGNGPRSDGDLDAFSALLQDALGAKVKLCWNPGQGGALAVDWFTVEELQGLMDRLSRGGAPTVALPSRPRQLRVELDSLDELSQLTDHLLGTI